MKKKHLIAPKKKSCPSSLNMHAINAFHITQNNSFLDFMIIVDVIYNILSSDDTEYWKVIERSILIIIETSEIITNSYVVFEENETDNRIISKEQVSRRNLANLALFNYFAEKIVNLSYERSWYAKKAG